MNWFMNSMLSLYFICSLPDIQIQLFLGSHAALSGSTKKEDLTGLAIFL